MTFPSLDDLLQRFAQLGTRRLLCKLLAENDNTKQQIYLGSSFEVLTLLPYREVRTESKGNRPNFKASLNLSWIDAEGHTEEASGAQLILYPDYPEVRLSGFLRGCSIAPSSLMQPVQAGQRKFNNGPDGRVLFLAISGANRVFAYVAAASSGIANEVNNLHARNTLTPTGVFLEIPILGISNPREALLKKLRQIHLAGWHDSYRLNKHGVAVPYKAQNGGGYTLEALFGIRPNGESKPDFLGWELKAYSQARITLITKEPDAGYYGENGTEAFLRRYGRALANDVIYFTGIHKLNTQCERTGQTLTVVGFDPTTAKIIDVTGGIELVDSKGRLSARWSFEKLIEHWGRKHASAAYVPCSSNRATLRQYRYGSPVLLGEGTEFSKYLAALYAGDIVYDPAPKLMNASTRDSEVKARSQFRMHLSKLPQLYFTFESVPL